MRDELAPQEDRNVTVHSVVPPEVAEWIRRKARSALVSRSAIIRQILVAAWIAEQEALETDTEKK